MAWNGRSGWPTSRGDCGGDICATTRASSPASCASLRANGAVDRISALLWAGTAEGDLEDGHVKRMVTWIAAACVATGSVVGMSATARADVYDDNLAAASRGQDDLWVFARRSSDGAILERHFVPSSGGWTAWNSLGGSTTSGPAAAASGPNIEVFARGQDGAI